MLKLMSWTVRPVYKRLFYVAVVVYMIGSMVLILDLCVSVGKLEHSMLHVLGFKKFSAVWEK